jgi:RNA polymerase sigma factor (sigma-70 family)
MPLLEPSHPITPELLLSHAPSLRALARGLLAETAADDVLQETWVAALEHPPRRPEGLGAWLRSVLRNRVRMRARGEARREARERVAARPEEVESTVELVERRAALAQLVTALESLPEPYGDALWMRYFDDLPAPEIARRLGIAEATVRSRTHRGLGLLRERLEREPGGERGAWMPALAAATGFGSPPSKSAIGIGVLIMGTNIKIAAVLVLLVVLFALLWRGVADSEDQVSPTELSPTPVEVAAVRIPVEIDEVEEDAEREPTAEPERVPEPSAVEPAPPLEPEPAPTPFPIGPPIVSLRRTIIFTSAFDLESCRFRLNGVKLPDTPPGIDGVTQVEHREVIRDELLEFNFDRATTFRRTFEQLGVLRSIPGEREVEPVTRSPLEKVPLLFHYDPRSRLWITLVEKPSPEDDPEQVDVSLLDGLTEDLDLRDLAPPSRLEPGGSYSVRARDLQVLFRPGGEVHLRTPVWDTTTIDANCLSFFRAAPEAFDKAKGKLRLVLVGPMESDSARQLLELELELSSSWSAQPEEDEENTKSRVLIDSRVEWLADGQMIWDSAAGRVCSLTLEGETSVHVQFRFETDEGSQKGRLDLEGESSMRFEVEEE